ncbi:ATP-binding protein [Amycolatopsis suaedae]|uniref:AfsR/SARP family transcriptional regulator n=1 Tax=Amycolatopsis suaedae TaxID=2510978 RepID=A0A4Q7J4Q0_9PSEU|nr:BTAD domain-containing putative transcriptional regulator [Amycolatopsis suaedae]RZQ61273.1 AfsR/SARP family transcriptional regulator [Amycolatopsis suaedae]
MSIELRLLATVAFRGREVTAPRLRNLIALLADDLRRGCGTDRLVEGLWPDEQPENPAKALRVLVSRVRAQLAADLIENTASGYRLTLDPGAVDTGVARELAARGAEALRRGDHHGALTAADDGLALWDGGDGDEYGPVAELRSRLTGTHRSLTRTRALALSLAGRPAEALEALRLLAAEDGHDEEVLLELLRSEAATAGAATALASYERYRRRLRDELGTDPGPALRALHRRLLRGEVVRKGVEHEPNALLGRANDLAAVTGMLTTSRVVTILGPGGLGKTRLAQAVSLDSACDVYFVPLAGVTGHVAHEVASVVGAGDPLHFRRPADVVSGIVNAIGQAPALLVLDNCEHVLDSVAELVRVLVSATREVRVLTTSRAPLGLSSEAVYRLPELPLATAVELFGQRARSARPGVELPADVVAGLCRQLDGLPLAIELAAARARIMSVPEIAARLDDRFALLRGGSRDTPSRHRTLHGVVEWSWNLLTESSRSAMGPLSVFPGGFTLSAAEHVLGAEARDILEHLTDQSLLKAVDTPAGVRFQMLETVREFCANRRDDTAVDAFLAWARQFGLAHHEAVFGADPIASAVLIEAEQDNLVRALRYGIERHDGATVASAASVLTSMWLLASNYDMTEAHVDDIGYVLAHYRPDPEFVEVTRTTAAICATTRFMIQGPRAVRSLVVLKRLPPAKPDTLARAAAALLCGEADTGEPLLIAAANFLESHIRESELDLPGALAAARTAQEQAERAAPWVQLSTRVRLGELCLHEGEIDEARHHFTAAYELFPDDIAHVAVSLVHTHLQAGDLDAAEWWLDSLLGGAGAGLDTDGGTPPLGVQAEILLARGEIEAGLRVWRDALRVLDSHGGTPYRVRSSGIDPWLNEVEATVVVAHAQHGRLDLVADLVGRLPDRLVSLLRHPTADPSPFLREFRVWGALLLAAGMAELAHRPRHAVRLIALAERCCFLRGHQPTMSPERARQAARDADRVAYDDAVSSYATLSRAELRIAALEELTHPDR